MVLPNTGRCWAFWSQLLTSRRYEGIVLPMNLTDIEKRAKSLMTEHGVGSLEFAFDRAKKRIGATHYMKVYGANGRPQHLPVKITLSKEFVPHMDMDEITDTILHEIAHALTGWLVGESHGPAWKANARKVGAQPKRCKQLATAPEASVVGTCSVCNKVVLKQHRLPLRVYFHKTCGRKSVLNWTRKGQPVRLADMPNRYQNEYAQRYNDGYREPVFTITDTFGGLFNG